MRPEIRHKKVAKTKRWKKRCRNKKGRLNVFSQMLGKCQGQDHETGIPLCRSKMDLTFSSRFIKTMHLLLLLLVSSLLTIHYYHAVAIEIQLRRKAKCWFPVRRCYFSIYSIPLLQSSLCPRQIHMRIMKAEEKNSRAQYIKQLEILLVYLILEQRPTVVSKLSALLKK